MAESAHCPGYGQHHAAEAKMRLPWGTFVQLASAQLAFGCEFCPSGESNIVRLEGASASGDQRRTNSRAHWPSENNWLED